MGGSMLGLLMQAGQIGMSILGDHARAAWGPKQKEPERKGGMPSLPEIPPIPEIPEIPALPTIPTLAVPSVPDSQPPAVSARPMVATVAESYAAEMDDPAVACLPCSFRHLTTMAEAARTAVSSDDSEVWRQQVAIIAAEAAAWEQYDLTPGKITRADERTRQAVLPARQAVRNMLAQVHTAPERLSLAWGALLECRRFAEGASPTEKDWEQVRERVGDVYGWVGYMESTQRDALGEHVNTLRPARQKLAQPNGLTPKNIAFAEEQVGTVAVALTPVPTREQVESLAERSRAIKSAFLRAAMPKPGSVEQRASFNSEQHWITDRDTLLPAELRTWYADESSDVAVPQDGLMGASIATATAWRNLLVFARSIGITVRERDLPSTFEGTIKGAFNPRDGVLLLGPAATAEDSDGLQTFIHEMAHAILHNRRCLPNPTPTEQYQETYAESVEEVEADATTFLTMSHLHLRIEHDDGTGRPAPDPRIAEASAKRDLDAQTYRRATWAARVLSAAAKGDPSAATMAAACPVRAA